MTFSVVATYSIPAHHPFRLIIAKGSVVEFSYAPNPQRAAIVTASGGYAGGVDGAVSDAGGPNLMEDRKKFSIAQCPEGSAVMSELQIFFLVFAIALSRSKSSVTKQ